MNADTVKLYRGSRFIENTAFRCEIAATSWAEAEQLFRQIGGVCDGQAVDDEPMDTWPDTVE